MDPIKEAFAKIKEDIHSLNSEIINLRQEISILKSTFSPRNTSFVPQTPTENLSERVISTDSPTVNPTAPQEVGGLKEPKLAFSIGNKGVPTVNPTYNQTNQQTASLDAFASKNTSTSPIESLQETLATLDSIKRDIRLKFKRLTPQEMLVFTTLYSLENRGLEEITYKVLATHISLSESSIRDYISRVISKGIPIEKTRLNNKKVILQISHDFQKIASLSTIMKLREL